MTSQPTEALHDLIYNAAVQPELWPELLAELTRGVGAERVALSRLSILDGSGSALAPLTDPSLLAAYADYYAPLNPLIRVDDHDAYAREWTPRLLIDEQTLPREELESSEYYNDFLKPNEAAWGLTVRLALYGSDLMTVDLGRSFDRGRFEAAELAFMARLHPHLVRAFGLSRRLAPLRSLGAGLAASLDRAPQAMLLLRADGQLLHANAAGERLLSAGTLLRLEEGRPVAAEARSAAALTRAIGAAALPEWERRQGSSVTLHARDGEASTVAVAPLRIEEFFWITAGGAVLLSVAGAAPAAAQQWSRVATRFGLTRSEARLAEALVHGANLSAAAVRFSISVNTARAQLAAVFQKTQTHRQVELVRLFSTLLRDE